MRPFKAGVSFWPVDARGLVAQAPLGDATQGSPGNVGMYTGAAAQAVTDNFQQSQDTLYALAGDTGGKALLDNNDLTAASCRRSRPFRTTTSLATTPRTPRRTGKFRRMKISAGRSDQARQLDYRQGYYADKEFSKFNDVDKERQLEDALMLDDPITDLTIAMEIDYFQLNRAEYFVPIVVKIPGRELALAKRGGAEHTLIDFVGEIKDTGRRHDGHQRSRPREHQVERCDGGRAGQAADRIRHRLHAAARQIHDQVSGARR